MDLVQLTAWIRDYARVIGENARYLTDLDAAIGDADHGINMDRGMTAVVAALDEAAPADMAALCKQVGMTLVKSVGGASGPLSPASGSSALARNARSRPRTRRPSRPSPCASSSPGHGRLGVGVASAWPSQLRG